MNKPGKNIQFEQLLELVKKEVHKCIRCGECRTVCPVFKEEPMERYTARGKIAIAAELAQGNLEFSSGVCEAFDNCLLCTGCASQCSSGVRADRIVIAVRQVFADNQGMSPTKKIIGSALSQPGKILDIQAKISSAVQQLLFKNVPQDSGMHRRFAMPLVDEEQYVPVIRRESFRSRYHSSRKITGKQQPQVIYFTGCMSNYAMTEISDSLVKVLSAVGVAVEVPKKQSCCGMPMFASGDASPVYKQLKKNIEALAETDSSTPIVTSCSSCGHMLKHGYRELMHKDPAIACKIEEIASRTQDITEYLVNEVGADKLRAVLKHESSAIVTYHDPCHLSKAQKVFCEPRKLLELLPGITFKEMQAPDACCGMGGTYCISNMQLSKNIESRKIADVNATGAECISTACPGCIVQLRDGLRRADNKGLKVKHVIQLLAEAL